MGINAVMHQWPCEPAATRCRYVHVSVAAHVLDGLHGCSSTMRMGTTAT